MPTRPTSPDPSSAAPGDAASAFGGMGAGLSFFQDWMKAAGSALPHLQGAQGMGGKAATPWTMPTLDPDELDKRIQDLRTVQFWLEQNARLISMTIQGLEVQRMTLTTLRGMNVSMDAVRDSLKARTASTAAEAPASPTPDQTAEPSSTENASAAPTVNPMQWWDTLTQQFSNLANQAVQVAQAGAQSMESAATAAKPQADPSAEAAARPAAEPPRAPARKAAAAPRRRTPGSSSAG